MSTFVLVHGAWCGGWIWRRVADRLVAEGHRVFTPTLTGVGERSHLASPEVDLDTHVADVANLIRWEELEDVVLVGHSYGGMVISAVVEVVEAEAIGSIVFVDAFVPDDGMALVDYAPLPPDDEGALHDWLVPPIHAAPPRNHAPDCDWLNRLRTPQPKGTFVQRPRLTGAVGRVSRKAYVLATGYESIFRSFAEKVRDEGDWRLREIVSGHDPMLSHPSETAALLAESPGL